VTLTQTDKKCSAGARYTAAWRKRARTGKILLKVEVDEAALVVALVAHRLLDPVLADDRSALNAAAQKALEQFCDGDVSPHAQRTYDRIRVGLALRALRNSLRKSRGRSR
jgi:hypothetical protein